MPAATLGARNILAVDLQPLAVETAQVNVRRNGMNARIDIRLGDAADFVHEPADLLLANLTYETLETLLSLEGFFNKAWYILSGVVGRQVNRLEQMLASTPLQLEEVRVSNSWSSLLLRNRRRFPAK